jgi:hypothetical protein
MIPGVIAIIPKLRASSNAALRFEPAFIAHKHITNAPISRNLGCIRMARPNQAAEKQTALTENFDSNTLCCFIITPIAIIKQAAIGVSYPTAKLPNERVGLKLIKRDEKSAKFENLVLVNCLEK